MTNSVSRIIQRHKLPLPHCVINPGWLIRFSALLGFCSLVVFVWINSTLLKSSESSYSGILSEKGQKILVEPEINPSLTLNSKSPSSFILATAAEGTKGHEQVKRNDELQQKLWGKGDTNKTNEISMKEHQQCWNSRIPKRNYTTNGYLQLICQGGAENHRVQISDAVALAYQLGASLLVPIIEESKHQPGSTFPELYSLRHFTRTIGHIVRVVTELPLEFANKTAKYLQLPTEASAEYIEKLVRPVYHSSNYISIGPAFDVKERSRSHDEALEKIRCFVNYNALSFGNEMRRYADRMLSRMKEAASSFNGNFLAIDFHEGELNSACRHSGLHPQVATEQGQGEPDLSCFLTPESISKLLLSAGYPRETAIYLTVQNWESKLLPLQEQYPNVLIKKYTLPLHEEEQTIEGRRVIDKLLDFYICSEADAFLPLVQSHFKSVVIGQRQFYGFRKVLDLASMINSTLPSPTGDSSLFDLWTKTHMDDVHVSNVFTDPTGRCLCTTPTVERKGKNKAGIKETLHRAELKGKKKRQYQKEKVARGIDLPSSKLVNQTEIGNSKEKNSRQSKSKSQFRHSNDSREKTRNVDKHARSTGKSKVFSRTNNTSP